nr:hypothetical protein BaRGS_021033 [Batillaria attramentaria]
MTDTDVIPESVMAVLRETCPEVDVSQSVPWTEVLSFAFWEADANQDGQLNGAETEQFAQLVEFKERLLLSNRQDWHSELEGNDKGKKTNSTFY